MTIGEGGGPPGRFVVEDFARWQAAIALIKQFASSSLRIKPIHPEKYYLEARINSGDRIVFRVEGGTIFFVDIVHHDRISRYGKRPTTS
jgi:hypothetical protein